MGRRARRGRYRIVLTGAWDRIALHQFSVMSHQDFEFADDLKGRGQGYPLAEALFLAHGVSLSIRDTRGRVVRVQPRGRVFLVSPAYAERWDYKGQDTRRITADLAVQRKKFFFKTGCFESSSRRTNGRLSTLFSRLCDLTLAIPGLSTHTQGVPNPTSGSGPGTTPDEGVSA